MKTAGSILLSLIFLLLNFDGSEPCKFGPKCDYPCHCQNNTACDIDDGSCPFGCDDGDPGGRGKFWFTGNWSDYGCQVGNVAYGKNATQGVNTYKDAVATLAVDGNHNPDFKGGSCAHSIDNSGAPYDPAWWQVDLGATYVVLAVNITNRDQCLKRTANLDITVSEDEGDGATFDLCKRVGNEGAEAKTYAECLTPRRGRYVRLKRLPDGYQSYIINICEIQVYGYLYIDCTEDYFGVACSSSCNCEESCDDISGDCPGQNCMEGWTGTNCQTECPDHHWGKKCSKYCNCMDEDEVCSRFDGRCISNCTFGYGGVGCDLLLPGLNSTMTLINTSSSTIAIRFASWSPNNGNGDMPSGYIVQRREKDTMMWTDSLEVNHNAYMRHYSLILEDLEPETAYYIRIIPFIEDADGSYRGIPTEESGPFATLSVIAGADGQVQSDNSATISGVVCFIAGLLVAVAVVLVWRRFKRKKPDNQELEATAVDDLSNECTENGYKNPVEIRAATGIKSINSSEVENKIVHNRIPSEKLPIGGTMGKVGVNDRNTQYEIVMIQSPSSTTKDDDDEHMYENQELVGRPLKAAELASYIEEMSGRKDAFKEEFVEIPSGMTASADDGKKAINKKRNRFSDICPYDHSRVVLKVPADSNRTDYINANYIPNYDGDSNGYIASQGPKKSTVVDMWAMVCQTGANRIVMLTNLRESGKNKCEQYWPDSGVADYGGFKVTMVDTETFADYTLRILSLLHPDCGSRPVYLFHFTSWPDSEAPELTTSLLDFRRKVRSFDSDANGPLIVHCSAGVGRTGTFLALDYLLDQLKTEGMVDVLKYTTIMRANRVEMIQTLAQYVFVYKTLLEASQTGETTIPSNEMETRYIQMKERQINGKSSTEDQFVLLRCLVQQQNTGPNDGAFYKENVAKNRDKNIVPLEKHRPFLKSIVDETNNYINAVCVDGYLRRRAFFATQLPLPNTMVDLWRLLYEHKCSSIITLEQTALGNEDTPVFWPTEKDSPLVLKQLSVTLLKEEDVDEGIIKMLDFEITVNAQDPRTVRMYQFLHWPTGADIPSPENTLKLLDHVQRWQLRSGHGALCFQCKYGYERCGLMIAACYMLEKLKVDREVDVFQAVKQVRIPRSQLVTSVAQYEFLHELAIAYINSCEDYANFK